MEQGIKQNILIIILCSIYCVIVLFGGIAIIFENVSLLAKIIGEIEVLGCEVAGWFIIRYNIKKILNEFRRLEEWKKK